MNSEQKQAGEAAHTPTRFSCAAVTDSGLLVKGPTESEVLNGVTACNQHAGLKASHAELVEMVRLAETMAANLRGDMLSGRTIHRETCAKNLLGCCEKFLAALAKAKEISGDTQL
jgi:hypothetical protein